MARQVLAGSLAWDRIMSAALIEPEAMQKPAPSRASRWVILAVIGIACYGGYYAFDYIGPLAPLLSRQLHFSNSDIGLLQAIYSLPNIVMALACGVVIDRTGTRKSLSIFGILIFIGLVITALSPRLAVMAVGRLLVGFGGEALALSANVAVARWFYSHELSLAFGVRGSAARLGSLSAQVSPAWLPQAYTHWRWPLLLGVAFGDSASLALRPTGFSMHAVNGDSLWDIAPNGENPFA